MLRLYWSSVARPAYHGHSIRIHSKWEHASSIFANRFGNVLVTTFANKQHKTATASGAADLRCECSLALRDGNQLVNQRRRDAGSIRATQLPFFPKQAGYVVPLSRFESGVHLAGNRADLLKVAEDSLLAV